ncbi:MAG TPA: hypothetical protein VFG83_15100 [Kofleriaceae bacterium]|nr:hypothetical protein [Kofleriaceae bacterium]
MPPKPLAYNATLAERIDLTRSLSVFRVAPDEPSTAEGAWFVPGQYVVLGMNNEANPALGGVRRAMSIASAPEDRDSVEMYIRYVDHPESDNPLTHLLWPTKAGDRVYLTTRATGRFTVEHTIGNDDRRLKVCVAAGTGLAPFLSMVRSRVRRDPGADLSEYVLLHGASYPADLGYRDELVALAQAHNLRYMTSVSRPKEAPEWTGDGGRVEDYFLPERLAELESRVGLGGGQLSPKTAAIYICGLQGTISNCILRLIGRGFIPFDKKIRKALAVPTDVPATLFYEQYDNSPVIDINDPELMAGLRAQLSAALA